MGRIGRKFFPFPSDASIRNCNDPENPTKEECEECFCLGRRTNFLSKKKTDALLLWPNGEQKVLYYLTTKVKKEGEKEGADDDVCLGVPGMVCLYGVQNVEGALVKPVITPGFTVEARNLFLHKGEKVDKQLLYNNEMGKTLPILRRCCFCWYYGERVHYGDGDVSLWRWHTELFSSATDIKIPSFSIGEPVCMAGLKKPEDVKKLLIIEDPESVRCWQQRTCEP